MLMPPSRTDLCLDYANTRSWRGREQPFERLHGMADLLAWLARQSPDGLGPASQAERWSRQHPEAANTLFDEALALREALYRLLAAIAEAKPPAEQDFASFTAALAGAPQRSLLVRLDEGYAWKIGGFEPSPAHLLAGVLWSAGDLVSAAGRHRLRRCANPECRFLFLDESKSGTRIWCDMTTCGNRAKARRHYARVRRDQADEPSPPIEC